MPIEAAAGDGGLEAFAATHAAAVILNQALQRYAEWSFVDTRLFNVARDTHQLGAVRRRSADGRLDPNTLPPGRTLFHDGDGSRQCFHIVDDGGTPKEAFDCREGASIEAILGDLRWLPTIRFLHHRRTRQHHDSVQSTLKSHLPSRPLPPEHAHLIGLIDGPLHGDGLAGVFPTNEEVRVVQFAGPARDGNAFQDQMRIKVHQQAVFECSGFCFIAVDGQSKRG